MENARVLSAPLFVFLELTSACNNRCPGCGNAFADRRSPQPLSAARWQQIVDRLIPQVRRLTLTGGEATRHPQFETIVAHIAQLDLPFSLFTNARWADPGSLLELLREIPRCGGLLVSLHGAAATSHEAFTRVSGSFAETVENIQRATAAGLSVATNTVITALNYAEIADVIRLSRKIGAHQAVFNRYLGAPLPGIEPTPEQLRQAMRAIDEERRLAFGEGLVSVKFGNCIPQCFYPSSSHGCLAGLATCTVDPWGNVRPCNHAPLQCGNLLQQPLAEIWQGPAMEAWRRLVPEACWQCGQVTRCHGGCRAVAMIHKQAHDPLMVGPLPQQEAAPLEQVLHRQARPVRRFSQRQEPFGWVLYRGTRIALLSAAAAPLLESLEGSLTLRQIEERLGQHALDVVGSLYQQGLVELKFGYTTTSVQTPPRPRRHHR